MPRSAAAGRRNRVDRGVRFNRRDLRDLPEPVLPPGFGFVTADQVTPEEAA